MITFNNKDESKQYISIIVSPDSTSIDCLIGKIKSEYPSIQALHVIFDESEILIPIESGINYGFSLNQLREQIKPIARATVSHFTVDMREPTRRYY